MHELVVLNAALLHVVVAPAVLALLSTLAPVAGGLAPLEGAGTLVAALAAVVDVVAQILLAPVVCLAVAVAIAGLALGGLAALAILALAVLAHDAAAAAVVGVVAQVLLAPVISLAVAVPIAGRALRRLAALAVLALAVLAHDAAVAAVVGVVVDAGLAALMIPGFAALVALFAILPRISTPDEEHESQSDCQQEELAAMSSGRHRRRKDLLGVSYCESAGSSS